MRGTMKNSNKKTQTEQDSLTNLEYIDLEEDDNSSDTSEDYEDGFEEDEPDSKGFPHYVLHILFFLVLIAGVIALVVKFSNWGTYVSPEELAGLEGKEADNSFDEILPLLTTSENTLHEDGVTKILAFGNAPLTDNADSEDGLANLIAEKGDVEVYNCGISGSRLATFSTSYSHNRNPLDAYSFYWLMTLAITGDNKDYYSGAAATLGDDIPPEAEEVYELLTTIDLNTIDVVMIMYDGTDYLRGRSMYNDENETDITTFTGNMTAGIDLLQEYYPHIRIIVMSPPYAFAEDESGNYVSSDMYTYGQDVLSTYVIKQYTAASSRGVSFVDNLYGSITENNAKEYLVDNVHLNAKGRELLAERFLYALNYYENME